MFVGMLVLLMLVPSVSADLYGNSELIEGQIVVMPTDDDANVLEASLLIFRSGTTSTDYAEVQRMTDCCRGNGYADYCHASEFDDWQTCLTNASAERLGNAEFTSVYESVPNANFSFFYWSPSARDWVGLPGCSPRLEAEENTPVQNSMGDTIDYYYATCEVDPDLYTSEELGGTGRINLKVILPPGLNGGLRANDYTLTLSNTETSASLLNTITEAVKSIVLGQSGVGGALPCLGIFAILGLLFASMYFSGKSPITLLDITTPRLPAPKGITASGQILAPFGYTEMKKTLRGGMATATTALAAGTERLRRMGGVPTSSAQEMRRLAQGAHATAGDLAAGDVNQMRSMAESLGVAALRAGMSPEEARRLARRLPYHYGEEEHRTVANLVAALEAKGGADALHAATIKQYLMGLRTYQSLEALTGHPVIGTRNAVHQAVQTGVGKAFGRFSIVGPILQGSVDSAVRSTQIVARGTKAAAVHGTSFAREMAKTATVSLVGGKRAFDARAAAAKRKGGVSGAYYNQITTPSHQIVVGDMFALKDKTQFFYNQLRKEVVHDEMRHVVSLLYGSAGVKLRMTDEQFHSMGFRDMDVLKMAGVKSSKAIDHMDEQIRHVLGNNKLNAEQKLNQLLSMASNAGIHVDPNMTRFHNSIDAVEHTEMPPYAKLLALQQVIEQHHNEHPNGTSLKPGDYHSFVGREHLSAQEMWNMAVFRTMIYNNEEGHVSGAGIAEALKSEWLKAVNRMVTLDPTSKAHVQNPMEELPEYMRNADQLSKVRDRARSYFIDMFTADGRSQFQKVKGKSVNQATIEEIVDFTHGGGIPKSGPTPDGRIYWHQGAFELAPPKGAFKTDMKVHWQTDLDPRMNMALGQWVQSRFTRGYAVAHDAAIEAQLDRDPSHHGWSLDERRNRAKQMWVNEHWETDLRNRADSQFCNFAYGGKMHQNTGFLNGSLVAFMEKALEDKGMPKNHADLMFLDKVNLQNPQDLKRLRELATEHKADIERVLSQKVTYDDLAGTNRAWVNVAEGAYMPYHKNMALGDKDRVMAGEVALFDKKRGIWRPHIPDEVEIHFGGRSDLERQWQDLTQKNNRNPDDWKVFMNGVSRWANEGGYSFEKQQIASAVNWRYANTTYDYQTYWNNHDVKVMPKREVMPLAPQIFRMFGVEAPGLMKAIKPFRDMALNFGDMVSRVALEAGGEVHRASWDVIPHSEYYRQLSWRNAQRIMSADFDSLNLSDAEKKAYRRLAIQQGQFDQIWAFAIDRHPGGASTSWGTHQAWAARFHCGPQDTYNVNDNLRAYMTKEEFKNFMAHSGAVISIARKMMSPYASITRGMQMSMQGYASKWDTQKNMFKQYEFTQPRMLEAMQALNPFSVTLGKGRLAQALSKANVFESSLEKRQLAGNDFRAGLGIAPQDIWLNTSGAYSDARIGAANPGLSFYSYRANLKMDSGMADYMWRAGGAATMFNKEINDLAHDCSHRRTASAEALHIRRGQELRGFGASQNSMFGWASPAMFLWHFPAPGTHAFGLRNITSSLVQFVKSGGRRGSYMDRLGEMADHVGESLGRAARPWKTSNVVYCPNCGKAGYRGASCSGRNCRSMLY